jgi:hypothetical protein
VEGAAALRTMADGLKPLTAVVLQVERQAILHYISFRVEK